MFFLLLPICARSKCRLLSFLLALLDILLIIPFSPYPYHSISTGRPPEEFIPPNSEPYEYIIFRASEVKDLAVDDQPMPMAVSRTVTDDPAVLNVRILFLCSLC